MFQSVTEMFTEYKSPPILRFFNLSRGLLLSSLYCHYLHTKQPPSSSRVYTCFKETLSIIASTRVAAVSSPFVAQTDKSVFSKLKKIYSPENGFSARKLFIHTALEVGVFSRKLRSDFERFEDKFCARARGERAFELLFRRSIREWSGAASLNRAYTTPVKSPFHE